MGGSNRRPLRLRGLLYPGPELGRQEGGGSQGAEMKRGKCVKCTNGAFPSARPWKMRQTKHFLDGGWRRDRDPYPSESGPKKPLYTARAPSV